MLSLYATKIENMIVASADLANSDKTDGFLKNTHPFKNRDFTGAFLHAGVSELTMAAVMNGMALHGGVIPACGTFFVFSDYHETCRTAGMPDALTCKIYLDTRCFPRRGRRSYSPARGTGSSVTTYGTS